MGKGFLKRVRRHQGASAMCGMSLLLVLGGSLRAYLALKDMTQPIIFHWVGGEGIKQIVYPGDISPTIVGVGVTSAMIVLLNFFIALELGERDGFWSSLFVFGTAAVSALLFIGLSAIIAVN